MQGESVSSILCTTSVDKLADENPVDKYRYIKSVEVPTLGFVDDILNIKKCGEEAKESNDYLVEEVNKRRLQFSSDKCVQMHVEKKNKTNTKKECKDLYIDEWKLETYKENEKLKQKDVHIGKVPIKTHISGKYY